MLYIKDECSSSVDDESFSFAMTKIISPFLFVFSSFGL